MVICCQGIGVFDIIKDKYKNKFPICNNYVACKEYHSITAIIHTKVLKRNKEKSRKKYKLT